MKSQMSNSAGEASRSPISVCAAILIFAGISAVGSYDPGLTLACGVVIALAAGLLWRLGHPPAIFMAVSIQLSQVVTPIIRANVLGASPQEVSLLHIGDVAIATWFALAAMLCLVFGLWAGQLGLRSGLAGQLQREARSYSPENAFTFCIMLILLAAALDVLGSFSEGLRQPCLALSHVRWLGVFVLACVCLARRRGYSYLAIVALFEVIEGFTGYFSDFKSVFLVLLVAIFSIRQKMTPRKILAGLVIGGILLTLGAWWSAVKSDYRNYISGGVNEQVAVVPVEDRVAYLMDKAFSTDWSVIGNGFDLLAQRLGYVDWLAATMRHVPTHMPFQGGAQIGSAVLHVIEPRLLFPDKPPLPSDASVLAK